MKTLNHKFEETNEKFIELQSSYEDMQQKYATDQQRWEDSQASLKNNMSMSQTQYNDMLKQIDELKSKARLESEKLH